MAYGNSAAFLLYVGSVIVLVFILVFHFSPRCGHTNVLVYTGICSLMGSLSVMSVKALGYDFLWYAPVLELPSFGFVMKGATLISIKPLDVEKKGNDHGDLLEVSGFHDEEDEERRGLFGEAVKELMKMKKTYAMEMTSF